MSVTTVDENAQAEDMAKDSPQDEAGGAAADVDDGGAQGAARSSKRFLVIGETGVGKTNAVNQLCGTRNKVSDSAAGTTFTFQKGYMDDDELGDVELIDTIGLSEDHTGTVHPAVAFAKLIAFAKDSETGFNGIFLVVGSPKITKCLVNNYRLFVEQVADNKVPCYLFINKQEFEEFKLQYKKNSRLYEKASLKFAHGFAGGFKMEEAHEHTIKNFKMCIGHAPAQPVKLFGSEGFFAWVHKLWRKFMTFAAALLWLNYDPPDDSFNFEDALKSLGVPESIAREVASDIAVNGLSQEAIIQLERMLRGATLGGEEEAKKGDTAQAKEE